MPLIAASAGSVTDLAGSVQRAFACHSAACDNTCYVSALATALVTLRKEAAGTAAALHSAAHTPTFQDFAQRVPSVSYACKTRQRVLRGGRCHGSMLHTYFGQNTYASDPEVGKSPPKPSRAALCGCVVQRDALTSNLSYYVLDRAH